jgi:SH3-like domain-containing protein
LIKPIGDNAMKIVSMRTIFSIVISTGVFLLVYPITGIISAELAPVPFGTVVCGGHAYTVDPDPKGTNIRSAPDKNSPVLRVITHDPEGIAVILAGSFKDWILIQSAEGVASEFRFQGKGWVHASLLAVRAVPNSGRKVILYSKPDTGSQAVKTFPGETEARLAGCKGQWMQVKIGKKQGWLAPGDYCGNPVTTCP